MNHMGCIHFYVYQKKERQNNDIAGKKTSNLWMVSWYSHLVIIGDYFTNTIFQFRHYRRICLFTKWDACSTSYRCQKRLDQKGMVGMTPEFRLFIFWNEWMIFSKLIHSFVLSHLEKETQQVIRFITVCAEIFNFVLLVVFLKTILTTCSRQQATDYVQPNYRSLITTINSNDSSLVLFESIFICIVIIKSFYTFSR